MAKVKLTVTQSRCRGGYLKEGQAFIVGDLCPPLCHELWHAIYPMVYALQNGGELDHGETRARMFDARCPDGGRVCVHGEVIAEKKDCPCKRKACERHGDCEACRAHHEKSKYPCACEKKQRAADEGLTPTEGDRS